MITLQDNTTSVVLKKNSYGNLIFALALVAVGVILFFTLDTKAAAPGFTLNKFIELWVILFFSGLICGILAIYHNFSYRRLRQFQCCRVYQYSTN